MHLITALVMQIAPMLKSLKSHYELPNEIISAPLVANDTGIPPILIYPSQKEFAGVYFLQEQLKRALGSQGILYEKSSHERAAGFPSRLSWM